jgi:hypothetical protein
MRAQIRTTNGRTLHILDLENLAGGDFSRFSEALGSYRSVSRIAPYDHVVIGCDASHVFPCRRAAPSARLVFGRSSDGADRALARELSDPTWIASRYGRVIIGSGDHFFAPAVWDLRHAGLSVVVVAIATSLSRELHRAAGLVKLMPEGTRQLERTHEELGAA